MKQFFILIVLALLVAPASFSQSGKKARFMAPLVAEEQIRHIVVTGNVDVLLIEDVPSNIGVKVPASSLDKLNISIDGDNLYISASGKLGDKERASAYITVSDLNSLELKGNVVVTSKGVLDSRQLKVVTNEKAMVALRSGGPIMVTSPASYQVTKEKEYYSVFAGSL
jgi:hypothetical protein